MKRIVHFIQILFKYLFQRNDENRLRLAEVLVKKIYPAYIFNDFGRLHFEDREFKNKYLFFDSENLRSYDRKYTIWQFMKYVKHIPGDTAECGVYKGATSWFICDRIKDTTKTHFVFDSFKGLSNPEEKDGGFWSKGNLSATEEIFRINLNDFQNIIKIYKGWIPERFHEISEKNFSFVHIDVDLYQPTYDSIKFFYPRLSKGGIIICDDYGFGQSCPGAKLAIDEYMKKKPEEIILLPTAQALIIKE